MNTSADTIIAAIQEAVNAATRKGVAVTVEITEGAFFPSERTVIKITARPTVKEPA